MIGKVDSSGRALLRIRLRHPTQILVDTYGCLVEWFGEWKMCEVVANAGQVPLIGVGLLLDHKLCVDYQSGTVTVD